MGNPVWTTPTRRTTMANWAKVNKIRRTVEKYYKRNDAKGNIDFTKFDGFITEVRKDWENAGFDLSSTARTCSRCGLPCHDLRRYRPPAGGVRDEGGTPGALKVMGTYGN
jgi:hypothetical protein